MQQIALRQKCSLNKIAYWLEKHGVQRRTRKEGVYLRLNPLGDPFLLKKISSNRDFLLLGLGLGLFWGEGSKAHTSVIRLGNSDPKLIKKVVDLLVEIFGIDNKRLRFGLQIFDDLSADEVKSRWSRELAVPLDQFLPKVVVTPKRGKGTYKKLNKWGVLTVYFSNVKLRKILDEYMEKYAYPY